MLTYEYGIEERGLKEQGIREIICESYHNFDDYRIQSKSKALSLGLWKYMQDEKDNNDTQMREIEPIYPNKPEPPTPPQLDAEDQDWKIFTRQQVVYSVKMSAWNGDIREYDKFDKLKLIWKSYLDRTIPRMYIAELNDGEETLAAWWDFITLKLSPQAEVRVALLAKEHDRLMQGPKSEDVETFFTKWIDLEKRMTRVSHPQTIHLKNDFCRMFEEKVDLTQGRIIASKPTLEDVINDCRNFIQRRPAKTRVRSNYSEVVASNATFENKPENKTPYRQGYRPRGCGNITGKPSHKQCLTLGACEIVNHRKRPDQNEMTPEQRKYLQNYEAYLKRNAKFCALQDEKFRDPLAKKIRAGSDRSISSQPRRQIGEIDTVISHSIIVRSSATRIVSLEDELLLDSGSNGHIINDAQIGDFEPTSIPSDTTIKAGDSDIRAVVKGNLRITLIGMDGEEMDLHMKNVLYVPGFHTNIISDSQMRKRGLYLDGKTDIWRDKDDTALTRITRKEELPYLIFKHQRKGERQQIMRWPTDSNGDPLPVKQALRQN